MLIYAIGGFFYIQLNLLMRELSVVACLRIACLQPEISKILLFGLQTG